MPAAAVLLLLLQLDTTAAASASCKLNAVANVGAVASSEVFLCEAHVDYCREQGVRRYRE